MQKVEIQDMAAKLCGVLGDLGFEYDIQADNRGGHKSFYIYARRPRYMEIRISDHPAGKRGKHRKTFDIGPHGVSLDHAISEIRQWSASARR